MCVWLCRCFLAHFAARCGNFLFSILLRIYVNTLWRHISDKINTLLPQLPVHISKCVRTVTLGSIYSNTYKLNTHILENIFYYTIVHVCICILPYAIYFVYLYISMSFADFHVCFSIYISSFSSHYVVFLLHLFYFFFHFHAVLIP